MTISLQSRSILPWISPFSSCLLPLPFGQSIPSIAPRGTVTVSYLSRILILMNFSICIIDQFIHRHHSVSQQSSSSRSRRIYRELFFVPLSFHRLNNNTSSVKVIQIQLYCFILLLLFTINY